MPSVTFKSASFQAKEHESVLDCLLRNGQHIPYACKAGMCQACLVRADQGTPPETASKWIKKPLQEKGFCLACQWVPESDVAVSLPSLEEFSTEVTIRSLLALNERVLRVDIAPVDPAEKFICSPGQYLTLINPEGISRSYSIANNFNRDGYLELHIAATREGIFTTWLFEQAKTGDTCHIRGPAGECFYFHNENDTPFPLILAGTGTGLAPLYGILNDALQQGHCGPVTLFHGAGNPSGLYYVSSLQALAAEHDNFTYIPVCREPGEDLPAEGRTGDMASIMDETLTNTDLSNARVYLCGNPDFVHGMRKRMFLKGTRSSNIYCDPFIERPVSKN